MASAFRSNAQERLQSLQELRTRTKSANPIVDLEFQAIIRDGQRLLEMTDQQLADAFSVSRPTVNRWMNGKNLPHPAVRKPIASWIMKQLAKRIKVVEDAAKHEVEPYSIFEAPAY